MLVDAYNIMGNLQLDVDLTSSGVYISILTREDSILVVSMDVVIVLSGK